MPLVIFRAKNTTFKQEIVEYLITNIRFQYFNVHDESLKKESDNLAAISQEVSNLLSAGRYLLLTATIPDENTLYNFINQLSPNTQQLLYLMRTDEQNLPPRSTLFEYELIVNKQHNYSKLGKGLKKIAYTLNKLSETVLKIKNIPEEPIPLNRSDLLNTTSMVLHALPVFGLLKMMIEVYKLYYIDNNVDSSLKLLLEIVKLDSLMGFNIRKGTKLFRVCYYKADANYTHLDQVWYPQQTIEAVRISDIDEPMLFIGDHWGSSFLEVFDDDKEKRKFIVIEIEVIKPFKVNYLAPLSLAKLMGASKNKMYIDYCKNCEKEESKLLEAKQELIRNFIGDFMTSNKNFDKDFTYDFTRHISEFLLKRFKGESIGYLSTQCNYQYNNFAIPANIADECLRADRVVICDHTFRPNGKGKNPWINFKYLKYGKIDPISKEIIYES